MGALAAILIAGCSQEAAKGTGEGTANATTSGQETPAATGTSDQKTEGTSTESGTADAGKSGEPAKPGSEPSKETGKGTEAVVETPVAGTVSDTGDKPAPTDPKAVADRNRPDGKDPRPDAVTKPPANVNPKTPPTPPSKMAGMDRLDRLAAKADAKSTMSSYVGNWSFRMSKENEAKYRSKLTASGVKGTLYTPDYKMTLNADGTFVAKEQFMSFDRVVKGTFKVEKGAARFKINTVNGKPPVFKSDIAGWVAIINKDGKLERSDEVKYSK